MRIVHVSTPLSWRGGEQQLAYLTTELAKKNILQAVICPSGTKLEEYCISSNLKVFSVKNRWQFPGKIFDICTEYDMDLIHAHDSHAHTAAVFSGTIFRNKVPVVVSRRVDFPVKKGILSQLKYNYKRVYKIICVSETIMKITEPAIKDKSKIEIVYSGVDLSKFEKRLNQGKLRKEFSIHQAKYLIGNVAAIAPHKDYITFVDTAELLIKQKFPAIFFIIGDGPEKNIIENYIKQKDLEEHIILTGFRNDIPDILPELDVFLFTSKTEGLGTSVIDAMASGVPVVATKAGGVVELIEHEKNGLLAEVGSYKQLAKQVLRIINNEKLKSLLKSNGIEKAKSFSKERMAEQTLEIYSQILDGNQYG